MIEKSEYNNGWTPCSKRLSENNQEVIACFAHGTVTTLQFYDKGNHRCAYCGCILEYNDMQVDHAQPLRCGGADEDSNMLPACRSCNHYKAALTVEKYRVIEKRLDDMFDGQLPLEHYVDRLEEALKEPRKPHSVNARILTYEDADMWEVYKSIGTPEECRAAVEKQKAKPCDVFGDGYADGHPVYDTYECPNCGKEYEIDYEEYEYCPNCGQHMVTGGWW